MYFVKVLCLVLTSVSNLMSRFVILNKKVGQTPLQAIEEWKDAHPEYKDISASYAGRLDPMAKGKLLILLGEECKKLHAYTGLDKEYEIEVLFDIGSDTGDALGFVTYSNRDTRVETDILKQIFKKEEGIHERAYPIFSSKTVGGKPLFLHALEGNISSITIPTHKEHIYSIKLLETKRMIVSELRNDISSFLDLVPLTDEPSKRLGADFRIKDVRASWEKLFQACGQRNFCVVRMRVVCGSGSYMRTLAPRIGEALGTRALALSINRTKIGKRRFGLFFSL